MHADRRSRMYELGVAEFIKFAVENASDVNNISCPCLKCGNTDGTFSANVIKDHLYWNGVDESYKDWVWHGEMSGAGVNSNVHEYEATVNMGDNVEMEDDVELGDEGDMGPDEDEQFSDDSNDFMKLVEDGDKPLYPGCTKHTKLNALIQTYNLKVKHGMSDVCYSEMLIMVGTFLPEGNEIPGSFYEAKNTLVSLGMDYKKIHACPNDCILYREKHADATCCPECGVSRWKLGKDKIEKQGVPGKVLWYFPPIPRFKRIFQSTKTAQSLTWHADERQKDGFMRHPADAPTWKLVDQKWPDLVASLGTLDLHFHLMGSTPTAL